MAAHLDSELLGANSPRWLATNQGLYLMQLVALTAMMLDHINWLVFAHGGDPRSTDTVWMHDVGRIAFPLFAFAFAVNLQRVLASPHCAARLCRMLTRLTIAGAIAQLPYWFLRGYFWPLNVMATFLTSALVIVLWDHGSKHGDVPLRCASVAIAIVGGVLVEYWWFGIAMIVASRSVATSGRVSAWLALSASLLLLCLLNRSVWPLAAVGVVVCLRHAHMAPPRIAGTLYLVYPLHLAIIAMLVA